jgi:hypothetical protein
VLRPQRLSSVTVTAEWRPLEHRFCYPLQLCAHLGFRLNVRRTHRYAIGTRVEQRPHDIFRWLLTLMSP